MTLDVTPSRLAGILCGLLVLTGCCKGATAPPMYCAAPRSIAVIVNALDSLSLASVADSAHGMVQSGAYVDSLHLEFGVLEGGTKLGTYQVTIERRGYRQWVRTNVQVRQQGPCGNVVPVRLTALLQRA